MILTITQPSNYHYEYTTTTQLETALVNCFCNTELRTPTVTKIKGLLIQTQLNTFVLFTLLKVALDERKTLTKISTRNLSQLFPQTSARFGPDEIRKPVKSIWQKAFCTGTKIQLFFKFDHWSLLVSVQVVIHLGHNAPPHCDIPHRYLPA